MNEIEQLRAENAQLRQHIAEQDKIISKISELTKRIENLEKENQKLRAQLRKFLNENTPSGALPPYLKDELKQITTEEHEENEEENTKSAKFNPRNKRKKYDRKEVHKIKKCPDCGTKLKRRKKIMKRIIFHLELPKVENVLHENETGYCKKCDKTVTAPVPDSIPKSKFDLNIHLLVILLYVIGTTQRKTREILNWFGVYASITSINNMIHRFQEYLGERKYKELEEELKKSLSCGADETSYSYRGKTFYIWAVANAKTVFYRIEKNRRYYHAKKLPTGKVIICDGYKAYDRTKKKLQRCWAHLLRKARMPEFPFDSEGQIEHYREFVKGLTKIYREAKNVTEKNKEVKKEFDKKLKDLVLKPRKQEDNLLKVLNYILQYEGEWFTFLERKGIEPTNNRCERALRPMVIRRKISQHNWSLQGMKGLAVMQSLYETYKLRNENFMEFIKNEISANIHGRRNF